MWKLLENKYNYTWKSYKALITRVQDELYFGKPNYKMALCYIQSLRNCLNSYGLEPNKELECNLILLFEQKMDREIKMEWEKSLERNTFPNLDRFIKFIENIDETTLKNINNRTTTPYLNKMTIQGKGTSWNKEENKRTVNNNKIRRGKPIINHCEDASGNACSDLTED